LYLAEKDYEIKVVLVFINGFRPLLSRGSYYTYPEITQKSDVAHATSLFFLSIKAPRTIILS